MKKLLWIFIGALGGLSSTAPMTAMITLMHRQLHLLARYPIPPREITAALTKSLQTPLGALLVDSSLTSRDLK